MKEETIAFVEKMIEGDERAFDEIYHSYSGKLYRMAYFITGNKADSEDVLQETFATCFLHRKSLKHPERFDSWIYQILVRTSWKLGRKQRSQKEISYEGLLEQKKEAGSRLARQLEEDASQQSPLDEILEKEASGEMMKTVAQLDIKYRTVILLYYFNELGIKDIAEITGLFEGTVKSRLSKARKLLKEALKPEQKPGGRPLRQETKAEEVDIRIPRREVFQGNGNGQFDRKRRTKIPVKMNRHGEVSG